MPASKNETQKSVDTNGFLKEVLTKAKASKGAKTPYNQAVTTIIDYYGGRVPKTKSSSEHAEFLLKSHPEFAAAILEEIKTAWSKAKKNKDYSEINSYAKILGLLKNSAQIKIQRTKSIGLLSGFNTSKNKTTPDQTSNFLNEVDALIKVLKTTSKKIEAAKTTAQETKDDAERENYMDKLEKDRKAEAVEARNLLLKIERLTPRSVEGVETLVLDKNTLNELKLDLDTVKELMRNPNIIACLKSDPPIMPWEINDQHRGISAFRTTKLETVYGTGSEGETTSQEVHQTHIPLLDKLSNNGYGSLIYLSLWNKQQPLPSADILHSKAIPWEQDLMRKDKSLGISQESLNDLLKKPPTLPWELDPRNKDAKSIESSTQRLAEGDIGEYESPYINEKVSVRLLDNLKTRYPHLIAEAEANTVNLKSRGPR